MAYCRECGNKVEDTDKFCSKCGQVQSRHKSNVKPSKSIKVIALMMALIVFCSVTLLKLDIFKSNLASINLKFNTKTSSLNIGDYIEFGSYLDEPILWRVVNKDENGIMLFSDKILCFKAFDARGDEDEYDEFEGEFNRWGSGSNYWATSNIREWLNSTEESVTYTRRPPLEKAIRDGNAYAHEPGFLYSFNQYELDAIQEVTHKLLLSEEDISLAEGGSEPISYYEDLNFDVAIYDNSYYQNISDKIFLLSVKELKEYVYDRECEYRATSTPQAIEESEANSVDPRDFGYSQKPSNKYAAYWLRTPSYVYSYNTYAIGYTGSVFTYTANLGDLGVRPALYIKDSISIVNGDGTEDNPYKVDNSLSKSATDNMESSDNDDLSNTINIPIEGNTMSNINNGGFVVKDSDWIYYSNLQGLYKVPITGGDRTLLAEIEAESLNIVDDTIYFLGTDHKTNDYGIFKINCDGTNMVQLTDFGGSFMYIANNHIYLGGLGIARLNLYGSNYELLSERFTEHFNLIDNEVYYEYYEDYNDYNYGKRLYKLNTKTRDKIKVSDSKITFTTILNDWIYFYNLDSLEPSIYKMKIDGSNITRLSGLSTSYLFNVSGDFIYYSNNDDEGKLYRANRHDGSGNIKLSDDYPININVIDKDVYYISYSKSDDDIFLYRIGIDGIGKTKIDKIIEDSDLDNGHKSDDNKISREEAIELVRKALDIPLENPDTLIDSDDGYEHFDHIINGVRYYFVETVSAGGGGASMSYFVSEDTGDVYENMYNSITGEYELKLFK